ncbi:hypothetical protein HELRODRAFT_193551 [Helobdella robusta]|uniref:ATP-grasp domain-containing protein n=1 Tax=Helobdella robusta TaxID=6412 RepID=T1FV43_HELRO|nr:hypothetical protein HELRODRAFT_193551 [Helobdella robusta]ESN95318.1 hypothetical protein HELRODRAFT_193551 [Helobdella robusta]
MVSVLVLGGGGREEAIAWKLSQSEDVANVFVCPGNGGTELVKGKIKRQLGLDLKKHCVIVEWCQKNDIKLVVIGPENLLADGLTDDLTKAGIPCFGPSKQAAQIESSKEFMKHLMDKHNIPTAKWKSFNHCQDAKAFINNADFAALVVKASGLAAGKGVVVARDKEEACKAVQDMLECLAFCDGERLVSMPASQDHKRLLEGDEGPNTGGMGAYCPVTKVSESQMLEIENEILKKTLRAMKDEGLPFKGVLYAGLMMTNSGPKVLEFNCRFGDPETQVLLPLLKSDLYAVMLSCVEGRLNSDLVQFETNKFALGIVLASEGYPGDIVKGRPITNLHEALSQSDTMIFHAGVELKTSEKTSHIPDRHLVTSGGRVMTLVATSTFSLKDAAAKASKMADVVEFEGKQFRRDIGWRSMAGSDCHLFPHQHLSHRHHHQHGDCREIVNRPSMTYASSGVNIIEGDLFVDSIKPITLSTKRSGCMSNIGSFGAMFDLAQLKYNDPILVSGTDGVGTKLKIAQAANKHDTIGIDLVAMCVNDVLCHGAEPIFFLDYFSCGKLVSGMAQNVIRGIASACRVAGCALVGGETAEMPGMYHTDEYDLAGFAVGVVERTNLLPLTTNNQIAEGDVLIGLSSSGLHSNGYSLVRKILEVSGISMADVLPCGKTTVCDLLLTPTHVYVPYLLPLMKRHGLIKGCAHITGGGLPGNVCRILPDGLRAKMDALKWKVPVLFEWLRKLGNVTEDEMLGTFNCGLGVVLVVGRQDVQVVVEEINANIKEECRKNFAVGDVEVFIVGTVEKCSNVADKKVTVDNLLESLHQSWKLNSHQLPDRNHSTSSSSVGRKKVAVLISGSGTNLQALIDDSLKHDSPYSITLVVSNVADAYGLQRAQQASIQTCVVDHKQFKSREEFDNRIDQHLKSHNIDFVCLAGFMRIVSDQFVEKWRGRMLNIHPSLLPSFKGLHVHRQVLQAGVRVSGCTVHFVSNELDGGAILTQATVPVLPNDTEDDLCERVKTAEHKAFPEALRLLTSQKVMLGQDGRVIWL